MSKTGGHLKKKQDVVLIRVFEILIILKDWRKGRGTRVFLLPEEEGETTEETFVEGKKT